MPLSLSKPLTRQEVLDKLPEDDEERKAALIARPEWFLLYYFPHRLQRLDYFHRELIFYATTEPRFLGLFPAAHGKTTIISTLLPIWAISDNPNIRIAVILKNSDDSSAIMSAIQDEMTVNQKLIEDWGPFREVDKGKAKKQKWSASKLNVVKRTIIDKSTTLMVTGSDSRLALGWRADWCICDDIVNDQNSLTPGNRQKLETWFNQGPKTMREDSMDRLTVVGTTFDVDDLYASLQKKVETLTGEPIYKSIRYDAVLEYCMCGVPNKDHPTEKCQSPITDMTRHEVLWPYKWTWDEMMVEKDDCGPIDFNKRYRNIAIDPNLVLFREEHIFGGEYEGEKYPGCIDHEYKVGEYDEGWVRYIGFDPAIGKSRHAKFCSLCVVGEGSCPDHDRCFWLIDVISGQWGILEQANLIIRSFEKYQPFEAVVETNSYQEGLKEVIDDMMNDRGTLYRITGFQTNKWNKFDPNVGIERMQPWFEAGKVHIPYGDQESRRKMSSFTEELIGYVPDDRNKHKVTDMVMSMWFAWRKLELSHNRPGVSTVTNLPPAMKRFTQGGRWTIQNPWWKDHENQNLHSEA